MFAYSTAIRRDFTIEFNDVYTATGTVWWNDDRRVLIFEPDDNPEEYETLTINLEGYGCVPKPGEVAIKDYSEHQGLTDKLVASGLVNFEYDVFFGPFNSRFCIVSVNP